MAIRCMNPNTIGTQIENMFNVTNNEGKNLIKSFSSTIENLNKHWIGTDAYANLTDLSKVYTSVTTLVKDIQKIIVNVNNNEILPLQKHIVASGGTCRIGKILGITLNMGSVISIAKSSVESWTHPSILADAETFKSFPNQFTKFVNILNDAKNELLKNWLDGANRGELVLAFEKFNNNVPSYKNQIIKVRDNLNTVAENKRKLL